MFDIIISCVFGALFRLISLCDKYISLLKQSTISSKSELTAVPRSTDGVLQ